MEEELNFNDDILTFGIVDRDIEEGEFMTEIVEYEEYKYKCPYCRKYKPRLGFVEKHLVKCGEKYQDQINSETFKKFAHDMYVFVDIMAQHYATHKYLVMDYKSNEEMNDHLIKKVFEQRQKVSVLEKTNSDLLKTFENIICRLST